MLAASLRLYAWALARRGRLGRPRSLPGRDHQAGTLHPVPRHQIEHSAQLGALSSSEAPDSCQSARVNNRAQQVQAGIASSYKSVTRWPRRRQQPQEGQDKSAQKDQQKSQHDEILEQRRQLSSSSWFRPRRHSDTSILIQVPNIQIGIATLSRFGDFGRGPHQAVEPLQAFKVDQTWCSSTS